MKIIEMKNPEMYEWLDFGIECGDGWETLLNNLTDEIKPIQPDFKFTQVKEKFGTLRAYCGGVREEIHDIIEKYEKLSETICEVCGNKGEVFVDGGWYKNRCEDCKAKGE